MQEWKDRYIANHLTRIAFDLDMVSSRVPKERQILECGSAPFILTLALIKSGYDVAACDLEPERYRLETDLSRLSLVRCDFETEKLPLSDNSVDLVLFNEVFEHLRINLIFTVSEVYRVLKPGGILMLSSPNLRSIAGIQRFLFEGKAYSCSAEIYEQYEKLETQGHMGHVREYTSVEVSQFLRRLGFNVEEIVYRGSYSTRGRKALIRLFPKFRPFVSYVAKKPG